MTKRQTLWLCAAALGACIASYVAYPYYALHRLEQALEKGDEAGLEALIDWPSLRAGLKDDLSRLAAQALAEQAGPGGDPEAALAMGITAMFMPTLVHGAVDTYVTPAGIARLMRREKRPEGGPQGEGWRFEVHRAYLAGPTSFHFEFSNPDDPRPQPAVGVLELEGLSWRLTHLILPIEDLVPVDAGRPHQSAAAPTP